MFNKSQSLSLSLGLATRTSWIMNVYATSKILRTVHDLHLHAFSNDSVEELDGYLESATNTASK